MKRWATIFLISTSWCIDVAAQSLLNQNAGNVFDHNIVFHNPPGIAYVQGIQGMVGMQWLYAGFAGDNLRNSIAYFIYPVGENDALGLRVIYFNSNILQQGAFSMLFVHKFFDDRLSLGFNANVLYLAYDKGKFQDFDMADPVIANGTAKNVLSFGAGFLLWLSERLAWGFSIDDVNQPNIALGKAEFKKDMVYKLGTIYLHPLLSPQLDVQIDGREVSFQAGAHRSFLDKKVDLFAGYHAAGSEGNALLFEISFMPGAWGLSYNIRHELSELGRVSNGSHFLTLHFNKAGSPTTFTKPVISLLNPDTIKVTTELLNISGEARSNAGINFVDYLRNGKIMHRQTYDQKLDKASLWY
ncbi:MAG: type IX secretion system membrane protein PorP/SprF, partial [bacterium]